MTESDIFEKEEIVNEVKEVEPEVEPAPKPKKEKKPRNKN